MKGREREKGRGGREEGGERAGEGPMSLSPPEMKSCVRPCFGANYVTAVEARPIGLLSATDVGQRI